VRPFKDIDPDRVLFESLVIPAQSFLNHIVQEPPEPLGSGKSFGSKDPGKLNLHFFASRRARFITCTQRRRVFAHGLMSEEANSNTSPNEPCSAGFREEQNV